MRKEAACLALSFASMGVKEIGMLVENKVVGKLVDMAGKEVYDVKRNCVMTISVVVNKVEDVEVLKGLDCAEVVETLSKMLSGNDIVMLLEVMEALNKLLVHGQSHFISKVLTAIIVGWSKFDSIETG